MTPCTADGGVARAPAANDITAPGICSATPMTLDPHANARHSNENRTVAPGEVARSKRTTEIKRRLEDRTPRYKY
jgi:hypothetical protein